LARPFSILKSVSISSIVSGLSVEINSPFRAIAFAVKSRVHHGRVGQNSRRPTPHAGPFSYGVVFTLAAKTRRRADAPELSAAQNLQGILISADSAPSNVSAVGEFPHPTRHAEPILRLQSLVVLGAPQITFACPHSTPSSCGEMPHETRPLFHLRPPLLLPLHPVATTSPAAIQRCPKPFTSSPSAIENKNTSYRIEQKLTAATIHEFLAKTN